MVYSAKRRKELIIERLYQRGHVAVKDLAGELSISEATARRDLKTLADQGQIELVYGGATLRQGADFSFRSKSMRNVEAKKTIGRLAASLIADGDQVFLDSGTTCFEMAPFLRSKRDLSVILCSIRLSAELTSTQGPKIILLGGEYRPDRMDTVGPLAIATLDQLRGYQAFVGADGLSMDFGPTASDISSAHLYRFAMQHARETTLLVDHSKFLAPSLFKIMDWDAVSRVVTDMTPPKEWVNFFQSRDIDLICADRQFAAQEAGARSGENKQE